MTASILFLTSILLGESEYLPRGIKTTVFYHSQ